MYNSVSTLMAAGQKLLYDNFVSIFFLPSLSKLQTGFQLDHSPLAGGTKGSIQSCVKILHGLPVKSQRKKNLFEIREIIIRKHQK